MTQTTIGSSLVVDGEISGDDDLVIQGRVKGRIVVNEKLSIEDSAVVEADVESPSVVISGHLKGNIAASERVELMSEGRMVGDIKARRILIADGASFRGSIDMDV